VDVPSPSYLLVLVDLPPAELVQGTELLSKQQHADTNPSTAVLTLQTFVLGFADQAKIRAS